MADLAPLRAAKGFLYEGGIRVPLIVRWPGVVPVGAVSDEPVISMDFFPTILDATNLEADEKVPVDGQSLMPILRRSEKLKRTAIYFHYPNYAFHGGNRLGSAIRDGNYKLLERFDDGSLELYDLKNDIGEKNNVASAKPDLAASLRKKLKTWRTETDAAMPTPRR